jgi:hypothetical protein
MLLCCVLFGVVVCGVDDELEQGVMHFVYGLFGNECSLVVVGYDE